MLSEMLGAVSLRRAGSDHRAVCHAEWFSSLLASRAVTIVDGLPRAASYYTSSVQVERQVGMRIFSRKFHKNGDISGSRSQIWMRFVSSGAVICIFIHAKREVWENFVARERPRSRFWVMSLFLEKVHFA